MTARAFNRATLVALGALWAATLLVLGVMLLGGVGPTGGLGPRFDAAGGTLGVTFIAAGQFVFLVIVADRLFPRASGRVTGAVEALVAAVMILGAIIAVVQLLPGGGA